MRSFLLALAIVVMAVAIACAKAPTATPVPSPTATATPSITTPTPTETPTRPPAATVTPTGTPTQPPTVTVTPIGTPIPSPKAEDTPVAFFLEVLTPENETVVQEGSVEVRGRTVPDAVVTVNGQVVEVGSDGGFLAMAQLEEGPNTIEVIASDFQGNQEAQVLTVVYVL